MLENPAVEPKNHGGGAGGVAVSAAGVFGEEQDGETGANSAPGNRWPEEETLALLRIRSDMDLAFRDTSMKAPLWDEVSRKLAEYGYHRSAKKCKEKFENVYKYHKRAKRCHYSRSNGKAYRFCEQLEALDYRQISLPSSGMEPTSGALAVTPMASRPPVVIDQLNIPGITMPDSVQELSASPATAALSSSCSSGDGSDHKGARKKRRKWTNFFEKLIKSILEKQEDLQTKFLDAMEKCERDRIAREEAWKLQELARIKREQELLMQERSMAAEKDAAVLAFLQKFSEQGRSLVHVAETASGEENCMSSKENDTASGKNSIQLYSSRWPSEEVEALIRIRANMELDYHENGLKGPLWEDISASMKKLGYHRSARRCKEKWENINKYFRRVKDSNKKRPVDTKTCPYFQHLEALYLVRTKKCYSNSDNSVGNLRPEELLMHMMHHNPDKELLQQEQAPEQKQGEMFMHTEAIANQDPNDVYEDCDYNVIGNHGTAMTMIE
ncbi:hypothetical protein Dimus_037297 [Dionaea muscipula]